MISQKAHKRKSPRSIAFPTQKHRIIYELGKITTQSPSYHAVIICVAFGTVCRPKAMQIKG
jgi:hypothetical protein